MGEAKVQTIDAGGTKSREDCDRFAAHDEGSDA